MASVFANTSGKFLVQFVHGGNRKSIYLGNVPKRFAEEYRRGVERLVEALELRQPLDRQTATWLAELAPKFREKLASKGLAEASQVATVGQLCTFCIKHASVEDATVTKYQDAEANLVQFFGDDRPLHQINLGDTEEFRRWLRKQGSRQPKNGPLAETTVSKRCQQAKQFFGEAVKRRWLLDNPFDGLKGWITENPDRFFFVDRDLSDRILEEAADPEFRLVIALCRFGGLRIQECMALRLDWINWDPATASLTVLDSKRKRYPTKRWRTPPLFPELRKYLEPVFEAAPEGAEYLIGERLRTITTTALSNRLAAICRRLGMALWEKPWQNMRSTRETELMDDFPIHVVCAWIGNDPKIAIRHYGQVTKDHHARALGTSATNLQRFQPDEAKRLQKP